MIVEKIANVLLPKKLYTFVKSRYRLVKKKLTPSLTSEKFRDIVDKQMNIKKGSVVFVHSSINNMNLAFPADQVIAILLDAVGAEGTLLFPCTHHNGRAEDYLRQGGVFNVRRSPTTMGLLPELVRRNKLSVRSLHPTNSIVAIGKYAHELLDEHPNSVFPCGDKSPYYKIVHYNGIIVGLGLHAGECLSFIHCAEDIMDSKFPVQTRTDEIFDGRVIDSEGKEFIVKTKAAHAQTHFKDMAGYFKRYIPKEIINNFKTNGVKYFTAKSPELYAKMVELAEKGITVYDKKVYKPE